MAILPHVGVYGSQATSNDHTRVGPDGLSLPVNFRSPYSVFPKNYPIFSVACDTYGSLSYMSKWLAPSTWNSSLSACLMLV